MSEDETIRDEDELGENTFGSLDFEADLEDVDLPIDGVEGVIGLETDVVAPLIEDPLDMDNEDSDDADDLDDGFSEFNDYEE